jgi:threonine 3-dehydrogenase
MEWSVLVTGVTKVAAERLGVYYHQAHGLDFRCIRLPIVVSRYAPSGAASAYVSRASIEAVREGRYEFQVRPDSRPSLIYVKDILRAFIALLEAAEEGV